MRAIGGSFFIYVLYMRRCCIVVLRANCEPYAWIALSEFFNCGVNVRINVTRYFHNCVRDLAFRSD